MVKQVGPLPVKTIVRFFACALIVLGIIFIADSAYSLFSYDISSSGPVDNSVPQIAFANDGNNAIVSITHNKGIARVKYSWNDETEKFVRGDSEKEVVISDLSIPSRNKYINCYCN